MRDKRMNRTAGMRTWHTSLMSLTGWAAFVEVCRTGSLSRAAAALGYTQSAVSRQVAALERDVGAGLLERLPRGVRPTPAGEAFLRHAQIVVSEASRARVAARTAGAQVHLALGAVPSAMSGLVPAALTLARERLPRHRVTLHSGLSADLQAGVAAGVLDLAVVTDYPPGLARDRHLRHTRLLDDEMCVILPASHPLASGDAPLDLAVLAEEVWAEDNAGSATVLVQAAAAAGFTPDLELEAGDLLGKTALVAAGHAVALVPAMLIPALRPDVSVRRLAAPPRRTVYAVVRRGPDPSPDGTDGARRGAQAGRGPRYAEKHHADLRCSRLPPWTDGHRDLGRRHRDRLHPGRLRPGSRPGGRSARRRR